MNELNERERAFEKKFEVDEELKFKIATKTAKMLGLWAAEQMGFKGSEAETYARKIVEADLAKPGHIGLLAAVEEDLRAKGLNISQHRLASEMERIQKVARIQVAE